jgi:hypothetical protein
LRQPRKQLRLQRGCAICDIAKSVRVTAPQTRRALIQKRQVQLPVNTGLRFCMKASRPSI